MPKFSQMVSTSVFGSSRLNALLMRERDFLPAIFTQRSRGNESTAPALVVGSSRRIMMVSARSPKPLRLPKADAYGESGSTQAPLSLPVMRKLRADMSTGPATKVTSGSVLGVPSAAVTGGRVSFVVDPTRLTTLRSLAFSLP